MRLLWVAGIGLTGALAMHILDSRPRAETGHPSSGATITTAALPSPSALQQAENATRSYEEMLGQVAGVDFCRIRSKEWVAAMQAALKAAEGRAENSFHLQAGQQDDEQEFKSHIYYTSLGSIMFNGMSVYDPRCQALAASPVMGRLDLVEHQLTAG